MVENGHRAVAGTPSHAQRNATLEPPGSIRDGAPSSSPQETGSESFRPYVSAIPLSGLGRSGHFPRALPWAIVLRPVGAGKTTAKDVGHVQPPRRGRALIIWFPASQLRCVP